MESFGRLLRIILALVALAAAGTIVASPASAADTTHWLCKPGQADNPCLGKLGGTSVDASGVSTDLDYKVKKNPPIDCFYVYPTQSEQTTQNANLNPDQELKDVAINQARMFSRECNVYAPLYRQYTLKALDDGPISDKVRDIAYAGVLKGWKNYLKYYNHGRGVVLIGHSQGSMNLGRLMQEEIDPNKTERSKLLSAIIPGANAFVPIGKKVGGQFQHIPTCDTETQLGCVIAYSSYLNEPPANSDFGRVGSGYWINPMPRADPAKYEVMCVNPSDLTGGNLAPLANLSVFTGQPEAEKPWLAQPDYYKGECKYQDGVSWLNISRITTTPPDNRLDLASLIASSGGNLHTGDINLAEDNLVNIVGSESTTFIDKKLGKAKQRLRKAKKQLKRSKKSCKKAKKVRRKAARHGKHARRHARKHMRKKCRPVKGKVKKVKRLHHQVKKYQRLSQA